MENIRLIELPKCKMVSSGCDVNCDFSETGILGKFDKWWSAYDKNRKDKFFPRDFIWYDFKNEGLVWYYAIEEDISDCEYEIMDFNGGLYAVATSIDGDDEDGASVIKSISEWIEKNEKIEVDNSRPIMVHVITPQCAIKALNYHQADNFVPIKMKTPE